MCFQSGQMQILYKISITSLIRTIHSEIGPNWKAFKGGLLCSIYAALQKHE